MTKQSANQQIKARRLGPKGQQQIDWCAPTEVPIGMVYNQTPHAVMMATPEDLHDFALGFALSEGVINQANELEKIDIHPLKGGIELHMRIPDKRAERLELHGQRRAHFGRAGCGLCGVDRLEDAIRPLPQLADTDLRLPYDLAGKAASALAEAQPLRRANKSVHGAAWVDGDGQVMMVREDIGRHNALDKLIGAGASGGADFDSGFALLSSRCTFELAQKCALVGIRALLTLSAPSASAVDTAKRANLALASWDRRTGSLVVFSGASWVA
ncbi:MAG: formate dehydrogenase accessory sulfurtransferase FdhD [Robiginitomaculum sp.]|nr:formate dehydrogenase accessory sulfurtransferase FdhD [Robiginitomaculum sp.]MDQ7077446.1 formate dehydrogenase accessory sulfurtransferase FdhD [Robiginitomaculum sp.]